MLRKIHHHRKVTLKFPWNDNFIKGVITMTSNENFKFTDSTNGTFNMISKSQVQSMILNKQILIGHNHLINKSRNNNAEHIPPTIRVIDKAPTNAPKTSIYTIDQLRKYFGFRSVPNLVNELKEKSTNFAISTKDRGNKHNR